MRNLSLAEMRQKQQTEPPAGQPAPTLVGPDDDRTTHRGYCRIFPATFPTAAEIPEDWKANNWSSPSAWCHVEGHPVHPAFLLNLEAIENS